MPLRKKSPETNIVCGGDILGIETLDCKQLQQNYLLFLGANLACFAEIEVTCAAPRHRASTCNTSTTAVTAEVVWSLENL